jgi:hypothetical protein
MLGGMPLVRTAHETPCRCKLVSGCCCEESTDLVFVAKK